MAVRRGGFSCLLCFAEAMALREDALGQLGRETSVSCCCCSPSLPHCCDSTAICGAVKQDKEVI